MHDYPAFRYIHQNLSGAAYTAALQLTFEYYIDLEWLDGQHVLACNDGDELVGGLLLREPEAVDLYDPSHSVTVKFIEEIGEESWQRLDAFELMMDKNSPSPVEGCYYIDLLAARPDRQGLGYGRFMLDYVADLARRHPKTSLVGLSTESPEKRSFYQHFGYQIVGSSSVGPITSMSFLLRVSE